MDLLKKEIKFRGGRRGIKELDLILGKFINQHIDKLDKLELEGLRDILLESDLDLLAYFQDEKELPKHINKNLFIKIKQTYAD